MSDVPSFPYEWLWQERTIRFVTNLTRRDREEFLALAPLLPVQTSVQTFVLDHANAALQALRRGQLEGAAGLVPERASGSASCSAAHTPPGR